MATPPATSSHKNCGRGLSPLGDSPPEDRAEQRSATAPLPTASFLAVDTLRVYSFLMAQPRYAHNARAAFSLKYHLVWCPKYRRPVLIGDVAERLKELLTEKAAEMGATLHTLDVLPDCVQLLVESDPTRAPAHIAAQFKGYTSRVLRREFPNLRMVLVGASEGWTVAREIAAARIPVIASALNDLPSSFEQLAATQSNVARMRAAGVEVSIGMINDNEARQVRLATQYAGNLVAAGRLPGGTPMSWGQAFAAISSGPAEALGLGDQFGSLRAGRRADVVIWDGDPLESANPTMVMIDGVEQPITNRQTKLRDRYRNLDETQKPKAYDR